jgi:hypothetical protein
VLPNGGPPPARRASSRTPRMWVPLDLSGHATVPDRSIQLRPARCIWIIVSFVFAARLSRKAAVRDQADASARDPPAFSRALLQLTCGSRAIAVIQRDPMALQSRTRVPMPKVEVLSIEYRTPNPDRRSGRGRGIDLERMDVVVKLGCAHQFTFESARLMTDWLGSVEHQYDAVRAQFTIDCERCARCEVGLRLRAASAAKPPAVGLRRPDGSMFIPSGLPITMKKPTDK